MGREGQLKQRRWLAVFCLLLAASATAQEISTGEELAKRSGCFRCHSVDVPKAAPSFQQMARKYAGQIDRNPDLVSRLADKVRYGPSHGGSLSMPAFRHLSQGDLQTIIRWILSGPRQSPSVF